jgi:hypothetical protein
LRGGPRPRRGRRFRCSDRLRTQQLYLLRFRLVRTSSRGSSWSFRGSSLRCRGSRQPPSSSILSSCDTLSLLEYLHHRLSLLLHYSPVDLRVRAAELSIQFSLAAGSSDLSVPELYSYLDGVHSTSSAQTSPSNRHSFH